MNTNMFGKDFDFSEVDYREGGTVHFGSCFDSLCDLEKDCHRVAAYLLPMMEIKEGEELITAFWTNGLPELICFCEFYINEKGERSYKLNYDESTL